MKKKKTPLDQMLGIFVSRNRRQRWRSILGIVGGILLFTTGCSLDPISAGTAGDPVGQCLLTLQTFIQDFSREILAAFLF